MIDKKEKNFIHYLKFFAILSVVVGHINTPLTGFIYSYHIPLFFIISGVTINTNKPVKMYLFDSLKRSMIPYFIFSFLGLGIEILKRLVLNRVGLNISDELLGIFYFMNESHLHHYGFILWFLPALFFSRSLFYLALKIFPMTGIKKDMILLFIFFLISGFTYNRDNLQLPFSLDKIFICGSWIALGYSINKYIINKIHWGLVNIFVSISAFFLITQTFGIPVVNISSKNMNPVFFAHIYIMTFFFLLLSICMYFEKKKIHQFLKIISKNTMMIYVFHVYTNNICFYLVWGDPHYYWVIRSLLSIVMSAAFAYLFNKLKIEELLNDKLLNNWRKI